MDMEREDGFQEEEGDYKQFEGEEDEDEEEEEEFEDYESEEEQRSEETSQTKKEKKKRKRKRKSNKPLGHRRNIKSKYDGIEDLNPEALLAQTEELERIKRLEQLQQQSDIVSRDQSRDHSTVSTSDSKSPSNDVESPPIVMVDLTGDDEDDDSKDNVKERQSSSSSSSSDMIIIDDISSAKKPRERRPSEIHKKYEGVDIREDGRILVNVGHPVGEGDVFLVPQVADIIKPHQVGGIRFMYDNVIESIQHYKESAGFGCILAHSMGLGKTLQVIGFIDIFLRVTPAKRVLCIVPVNTLQNWLAEFDKWLPVSSGDSDGRVKVLPRSFTLFMLSESVKSMESRYDVITRWYKIGGVLLMGYEMYRLLSLSVPSIGGNIMAVKRKKKSKSTGPTMIDLDETEKEMDILIEIQQALCSPGPDMIVCDEGHRIKNDSTNISQALKRVRTRRRIVMTGYPLQNNLLEYWCMVDFVRPMYLGTKQEFMDLFERPISNGQCIDSTPGDVQLMKYRSHVLHELLKGFVLRRGHDVLQEILPPKFEHVLLLRLSHVQQTLYDLNITSNHGNSGGAPSGVESVLPTAGGLVNVLPPTAVSSSIGPLKAFAVSTKIWNHPDIYYDQSVDQKSNESLFDEDSLPQSVTQCKLEWPHASLPEYQSGVLENSPKMVLVSLLTELSVATGDKILIFSQSLPTLSYIEKVLSSRPFPVPFSAAVDGSYLLSENHWVKGKNFYRLDGSTSSMERDRLIGQFNSPSNQTTWAFLLSTKAGCLGVNLVGANRVIVVDVSWNPCYDSQAVCRVYRYGQVKPCYIYRLVSDLTMEKRMYDRQVTKQSMADRVVDELNPERHFTANDIFSLLAPMTDESTGTANFDDLSSHSDEFLHDPVMVKILKDHSKWLTKLPFKHESLLLDSEERLTEVEKYVAMKGFQQQLMAMRRGPTVTVSPHLQQSGNLPRQQVPVQLNSLTKRVAGGREGGTGYAASEKVEVICLDSDSDSEVDILVPSNETANTKKPALPVAVPPLIVHQQPNTSSLQSSRPTSSSLPSLPSLTYMQTNSVQSSQQSTITGQSGSGPSSLLDTSGGLPLLPSLTHMQNNQQTDSQVQHNALSLSATDALQTTSTSSNTISSAPVEGSNLQQHTPSEAAVAQALAGFIQFQRQLCKSLNKKDDSSQSSSDPDIFNTLASTLQQVQKQSLPPAIPPDTSAPPLPTSFKASESPSIALPQTSHTSFSSQAGSVTVDTSVPSSSIHSYISSLQQHTPFTSARKAAIVAPISHRPPPISIPVNTDATSSQSVTSSTSSSFPNTQ